MQRRLNDIDRRVAAGIKLFPDDVEFLLFAAALGVRLCQVAEESLRFGQRDVRRELTR